IGCDTGTFIASCIIAGASERGRQPENAADRERKKESRERRRKVFMKDSISGSIRSKAASRPVV
ncbi:MAG: hypothetical protein COW13_02440, partial [Candidatus Omnitrophica bacterium CG12_big_fil_rev_8_21_14_0_65_50_5]